MKTALRKARVAGGVLTVLIGSSALLLLAGCGSGTASPADPTAKPVPTAAASPTMAPTGSVVFGASLSEMTVEGRDRIFYSPKTLAWVAHWNFSAKGAPATMTVTRLNGPGPHPLVVWSGTATVKAGAMTTAMALTSAQMKAHKIQDGGKFEVKYSSGSTVLATGTFSLSSGSTGSAGSGPY